MTRPTILVVDDHGGFRATARRLLERDGWSVIGEAADGLTGLAAAASLAPDVDGFAVAERLAARAGAPSIILISSRDHETYRERVRSSPAAAFLAKQDLDGTVLRSLLGLMPT